MTHLALLVGLGSLAFPASDDWRAFRGTHATACRIDAVAPRTWNDDQNVRWRVELPGPGTSSPIVLGDSVCVPLLADEHLYWVDESGMAHCVTAGSGEVAYRERLESDFYASVVSVGDALYAVRIEADESSFDATPAFADGQLFLRSRTTLYCIEAE